MKKTILFTILIGSVSMAYATGSHKDGHHMEGEHWTAPKGAAQLLNPVPSDSNSTANGMKIYAELCSRCHGNNGQGDGPDALGLKVKPTNLQEMAGGHTDGDFAWKIKTGRGEMPAWGDELEETEVWDLVNYIQSLKEHSPANEAMHENEHEHAHEHD